jgi:hypothetical protein
MGPIFVICYFREMFRNITYECLMSTIALLFFELLVNSKKLTPKPFIVRRHLRYVHFYVQYLTYQSFRARVRL